MEQPKTDSDLVKIQHEMCLHMVEKALTNSTVLLVLYIVTLTCNLITFESHVCFYFVDYMIGKLVGEIESLGCGITESFFRCMREPGTIQVLVTGMFVTCVYLIVS